jgi:hypothetical protein
VALTEATLAEALEGMVPAATEADAITALTNAYETYTLDAVSGASGAVGIEAAAVTVAKGVMASALGGMSATDAGKTKIPAAVAAFWGSIATQLAQAFVGSVATVPPPHATLAADFATIALANVAGEKSLEDSAAALAGNWHTAATTGGTTAIPPPAGGTIYAIL